MSKGGMKPERRYLKYREDRGGRGSRSLEMHIEAHYKRDLDREVERIYRAYHPFGYNTYFHTPQRREGGGWEVRGHRALTCD